MNLYYTPYLSQALEILLSSGWKFRNRYGQIITFGRRKGEDIWWFSVHTVAGRIEITKRFDNGNFLIVPIENKAALKRWMRKAGKPSK